MTCEDVRYGVSRSFAEPFASQGLNFPLAYLDIPRKADGASVYAGPFAKDRQGQAAFDKAVACDGSTVTFRLSTPMADFNQVVALPVFAPVKQSQDKAEDGTYAVFSNGPYQLKDAWNPSAGGTFERNPQWDKASDPIRQAKPDVHRLRRGHRVADRGAAGHQRRRRAPPGHHARLGAPGDAAARPHRRRPQGPCGEPDRPSSSTTSRPTSAKGVMRNAKRPQPPCALATNREGYVNALGGASAADARPTPSSDPRCPGTPTPTPSGRDPRATPGGRRPPCRSPG